MAVPPVQPSSVNARLAPAAQECRRREQGTTTVLLQIAFDKPEHLSLMPRLKSLADIIEVGTPVLKRFGVSAIATARELCPDVVVLADTKTVDGGQLEADMVFGAGAALMTVLSSASRATHEVVGRRAAAFGATVVVDTITKSGKADLLPGMPPFRKASATSRSIRRPMCAMPATRRPPISTR